MPPLLYYSHRQAALAAHAEALAVLLVAVCGGVLLFGGQSSSFSSKTHDAWRPVVGGLLLAQAAGAGVLLAPLLGMVLSAAPSSTAAASNPQQRQPASSRTIIDQQVAVSCSRAAAVTTATTGLCLTLLMVLAMGSPAENGDDDTHDFRSSTPQILVAVGMALFGLSSSSLMASFWPHCVTTSTMTVARISPTRARVGDRAAAHLSDDEQGEAEQAPLLPSAVVAAFAPSPDEAIGVADIDEETGESHYQLLEEPEEKDGEESVTDDRPPDPAVVQESSPSIQNHTQQEIEDVEPSPPLNTSNSRIRGTRRLLQLAAPELRYLYAGCAVLLCRLPFSLAMPHFVSTTLAALANHDFGGARHEIRLLLLAGTIDAALDFWGFFLFGYANQRIVRGLRVDLFRRLLGQDVAFFDQHSSGELSSRLNSDCSEMAGDLTWFFRFSIESTVRITGITAYMLIRSPLLGACALSIVPAVAVINKLYGDWLRKNAVQVQDALAEANAVAQEALANVRTVLAFAAERQECTRYETKIERQYLLNVKQLYMTAAYYMVVSTFLCNTIVQGTLLFIGLLLIEHGSLTPGVLLAFMLYQSQLQNESMNLFNSYTSLIKSSGAGDKVFALLDRSPPPPSTGFADGSGSSDDDDDDDDVGGGGGGDDGHVDESPSPSEQALCTRETAAAPPQHSTRRQQYDVILEKVSFRYPSRPENTVLHELDLQIPKGKTVALVGKSGSGKSTLVSLLQRFYDPTNGRILINGVDLRELNLRNHRRQIGVVTQDPALFRGTLWENITYGCGGGDSSDAMEVTEADVQRAARVAHADSFIESFAEGYATEVGERGVKLSGGQKQRIAIARAVALQPSLLLLDEATSSLDYASETAVQEALDELLREHQDMTTVIIAHRLRTVRHADRIVVLQDGRVVEQGTHEELLDPELHPAEGGGGGVYREMVERAGSNGVFPES